MVAEEPPSLTGTAYPRYFAHAVPTPEQVMQLTPGARGDVASDARANSWYWVRTRR